MKDFFFFKMILDEAKAILGKNDDEQFVADALDVVKLKFVSSCDAIPTLRGYAPEFAHQHFGDSEKIFGYKNLSVSVLYTDVTLFLTTQIKFDEKIGPDSKLQCDDIEEKIKDALPSTQLDAYLSYEGFQQKIIEQKKFYPFGTLISKFKINSDQDNYRQFELYKFDKNETILRLEEGIKYLERAQSIAYWYIDAIQYTDEQDPRFFNYFLFESITSPEHVVQYKFAGYANLYRFYHYPDMDRIRIAQFLLVPSFRGIGLGHRFMQSIYSDLYTIETVFDITAEAPADLFIFMRDYTDCLNCLKLPEFSRDLVIKGFTKEMWNAARVKYKLNKAQACRVYEILRLFYTNMNIPSEREVYKSELIKRLKKGIMDPTKDGGRLSKALAGDEQSLAIAIAAIDPEHQTHQLDALYENLLLNYKHVLERLALYENHFCR